MAPSRSSRFHHPRPRPSSGVPLLLAACAVVPACGVESVLEIRNPDGLPWGVFFRADATPTEIAPGEEMRIVLRLENTNDHDVSLRFGTTCAFLFLVEEPDGARVFPQEGTECSHATNAPDGTLHMLPHQEMTVRFTWTGVRESEGTTGPAAPGEYRVFGAMEEDAVIRTPPVEVTVR